MLPPCQITSSDSANKEEEEVRKMLRECLDLRKKYVYREEVTPSKKVAMGNSTTSEETTDPFHFETVEASAVSHSFVIHAFYFSLII